MIDRIYVYGYSSMSIVWVNGRNKEGECGKQGDKTNTP